MIIFSWQQNEMTMKQLTASLEPNENQAFYSQTVLLCSFSEFADQFENVRARSIFSSSVSDYFSKKK